MVVALPVYIAVVADELRPARKPISACNNELRVGEFDFGQRRCRSIASSRRSLPGTSETTRGTARTGLIQQYALLLEDEMGTYAASAKRQRRGVLTALGVVLIIAGFCGHFFAAKAIGGTYIAYRDHMAGFFGMTILSGAIVALLGRKFWRGRSDLTLLIIGIIQAAFGIFIYINRLNLHG